jgi:hypothetical protein
MRLSFAISISKTVSHDKRNGCHDGKRKNNLSHDIHAVAYLELEANRSRRSLEISHLLLFN